MARFGKSSTRNLESAHPDLQRLFRKVVEKFDCSVICGARNEDAQTLAFVMGKSSVEYPNSKHNKIPSEAVDVIPYPFKAGDWNDLGKLYMFVGYVKAIADEMGIEIRVGADWDGDGNTKDQNFHDLPHFEIVLY